MVKWNCSMRGSQTTVTQNISKTSSNCMFKEVYACSSNVVWEAIVFVVKHINKVLPFNMMWKIFLDNLGLRNLICWNRFLTLLRANDSSSWPLNCAKSFGCSATSSAFCTVFLTGCLSLGSNSSSSSSSSSSFYSFVLFCFSARADNLTSSSSVKFTGQIYNELGDCFFV